MKIQEFHDSNTGTFSYLVICSATNKAVIIDSVAQFDVASARISHDLADKLITYIKDNNLELVWILETHIHADHLTAANYIKGKLGGKIAVNEGFKKVKDYWAEFFDISLKEDSFDHFLQDREIIKVGEIDIKVIMTPGHTPTCSSFIIENNIFVGDVLLDPSIGCARCDFPGGNAETLFDSVQTIYELGDDVNIYTCHDYPKIEGQQRSNTTIGDHKKNNVLINAQTTKQEFVKKRNEKDAKMPVPRLLLPSLQANINAGFIDGFIKSPINKL